MTESKSGTEPSQEADFQRQAKFAIVGVLAFAAIWVLLDFIDPNYNWAIQTGSEHLNGPYRSIMTMGFLSFGAACWYLAAATDAAFRSPVHSRTSVFMFRLAAVCFFLAGLFPGYEGAFSGSGTSQFETISTYVHSITSVLGFIALFVAENTLSNRLRRSGRLRGLYKILQPLAILAVVALSFTGDSTTFPGITQRIFLFVFIFPWGIIFARGISSNELPDRLTAAASA